MVILNEPQIKDFNAVEQGFVGTYALMAELRHWKAEAKRQHEMLMEMWHDRDEVCNTLQSTLRMME